jgi:prepilin peptidase CpaA
LPARSASPAAGPIGDKAASASRRSPIEAQFPFAPKTDQRSMASTLLHLSALAFFPALMALSASMDLLTFTIPNRVCVSLALGYLVLAASLGVPAADIALNISCALAILALAFVMFNLGWVGGGDAKLAAATAIWLGWSSILDYGVTAALCGGVLTLVILGGRMAPLPAALERFPWVARLHDCKSGVPYGIALAAAGLMQYPGSGIWAAAV